MGGKQTIPMPDGRWQGAGGAGASSMVAVARVQVCLKVPHQPVPQFSDLLNEIKNTAHVPGLLGSR